MMATRNYIMKLRIKQSFPSPSHLQMCGLVKEHARISQKMHQKQHSSAKSNHKDGAYQMLAETKPEIFWSHIYDQGLFDSHRSVTLPFPSLAEIPLLHCHCGPEQLQHNDNSWCQTRVRQPLFSSPWAAGTSARGHLLNKVLRTSQNKPTDWKWVATLRGSLVHVTGLLGRLAHSSWLTKKNKLCKSRIPRKDWRADCSYMRKSSR